ncbi:MAG TPA: glycosyltransferase family 2 protein [Nitrospiria bacterium]|nr:glycosyltransferase family 2 protein [Nitrospiria bacterium]
MYRGRSIGVVIPAYNVERSIRKVVEGLPSWVDRVIVVDDASRDGTLKEAQSIVADNLIVLHHEVNQGVGGATMTGFRRALEEGVKVAVKMDGDGQMDPAHLPALLDAVTVQGYDYSKGNRFLHTTELSAMPRHRLLGNFVLTFLTKLTSGYWNVFDPQNGYLAIRREPLSRLSFDRIAKRFFFENDLLIHLNILNYRVKDVPIPAIYGDEVSNLKVSRVLGSFPLYLFRRFWYRIYQKYVLRDFSPIAVFLFLGLSFFLWGLGFGFYTWWRSAMTGHFASTGTVMLSVLPFLIGFELILQAVILDIQATPK